MTLHPVPLEAGQHLSEPLSADEVKSFLRVDHDEEDPTILELMAAAREAAELHHNRILTRRKFRLVLETWPSEREIALLDPLISVDQVSYKNAQGGEIVLDANTDYTVDTWARPGRIILPSAASWPSAELAPGMSIYIVFTAGFLPSEVPFLVKAGLRFAITSWYDNRDQKDRTAPQAAIRCWEVDRLHQV
jgi:uncharacterized phiE125 gp8 family phage protein